MINQEIMCTQMSKSTIIRKRSSTSSTSSTSSNSSSSSSSNKTQLYGFNATDTEQLSKYLTDSFKRECISNCDLLSVVQSVYFNDNYPENKCIELVNKCPIIFKVYKNNVWKEVKGEKVLLDIIENCYRILMHYYVFNKSEVDDYLREKRNIYRVKVWLEEMSEEDPRIYFNLREALLNYMI